MNASDLAYIQPTVRKILSAYVNGWMSMSAARRALKALGVDAEEAQHMLHLAWHPKA